MCVLCALSFRFPSLLPGLYGLEFRIAFLHSAGSGTAARRTAGTAARFRGAEEPAGRMESLKNPKGFSNPTTQWDWYMYT